MNTCPFLCQNEEPCRNNRERQPRRQQCLLGGRDCLYDVAQDVAYSLPRPRAGKAEHPAVERTEWRNGEGQPRHRSPVIERNELQEL